jgi:hypothetical protein
LGDGHFVLTEEIENLQNLAVYGGLAATRKTYNLQAVFLELRQQVIQGLSRQLVLPYAPCPLIAEVAKGIATIRDVELYVAGARWSYVCLNMPCQRFKFLLSK